jgi:MSHA biogenesis protein MshJ
MASRFSAITARIDRMALRERLMMLAAAVGAVFIVIDTLLVSPVLVKRKAALEQHARQELELKTLGARMQGLARSQPVDPDTANRARISELNAKLAALESDVKGQSTRLISAQHMRTVLQQLLASRPGLELVELKTLPQTTIDTPVERAAPAPGGAATTANAPGPDAQSRASGPAVIYKHGVQLAVRGRYLDLVGYLRSIEQMPVRLYWDRLEAVVEEHPLILMRITLYTVSLDKAWMQV